MVRMRIRLLPRLVAWHRTSAVGRFRYRVGPDTAAAGFIRILKVTLAAGRPPDDRIPSEGFRAKLTPAIGDESTGAGH